MILTRSCQTDSNICFSSLSYDTYDAYRTFGKIKMLPAGFDKRALQIFANAKFQSFPPPLSFKAIASEQMLFSASVCREVPGPGP